MTNTQPEEDFPNPIHNPKAYQSSAFLSNNSDFDEEELSLYKDLMQTLVMREPRLHPNLLGQDDHLTDDFADLGEAEQRKQYRAWAGKIVALIKPILSDEKYLCGLCYEMGCTFMDIIYCMYAYFGALMYKQPQFSRWLSATVSEYSDESKKAMSIPRG